MIKKIFVFCTLLTCIAPNLMAEAKHGLNLSTLKYPENFTHFEYANPAAPKGGAMIISSLGGFDSLNPFTEKGNCAVGMTFIQPSYPYATLTKRALDEAITAYGYIAQSMEIVDNGAGVIYTLRPQAQFHDGTPIIPDDVVATFQAFKTKGHIMFKQYYNEIVDVKKVAANQVKFIFKTATNKELPIIIGEMVVLPKKELAQYDLAKSSLKPIMGSGPYKIKSFKQDHYIEYERVKNWWGENLPVNKGQYNLDTIKIIYFKDPVTQFEAFKNGDIDLRVENLAKNWMTGYDFPLIKKGTVVKQTIPHNVNQGFTGLEINMRKPVLQDRAVRQALSLAYDFEWANKNLFYGVLKRGNSYFTNSQFAGNKPPSGQQLYILNKHRDKIDPLFFQAPILLSDHSTSAKSRQMFHQARKLLLDAGYKISPKAGGKTQLVDKKGQPVVLTLLLPQIDATRAYGKYKQDLQEWLGIELILKVPADISTYTRLLDQFDYDLVLIREAQSESPGNEQSGMWGSNAAIANGSKNYSGLASPGVDAVIQEIVDASTQDQLIAATQALDWLLLQSYIGIPCYYNDTYWLAYKTFLKRPARSPSLGLTLDTWWIDKK